MVYMIENYKDIINDLGGEHKADLDGELAIVVLPLTAIREQDINARIMKADMFRQLTSNMANRGALESLPFCALMKSPKGYRVEMISGHHRLRAAREAGLQRIPILLDVSGLTRSKVAAKQLAHNSISGFDDKDTMKEIAKIMDDVNDMMESYVGKDILGEPEEKLNQFLNPTVDFDFKSCCFVFLPHQIENVDKLVKLLDQNGDYIGYAHIDEYKEFIKTLTQYQKYSDIKNVGAAIHAMTECALEKLSDVGYEDSDEDWVGLSAIFGGDALCKTDASIVKDTLKQMVKDKIITSKNKSEAIVYLCNMYLGKENDKAENSK